MSDAFQALVLQDAPAAGAGGIATRLMAWLVDRRIVEAARSDCVLGAGGGHRPGALARAVCADDFTEGLRVNGVQVETGGLILGAPAYEDLLCPHCGTACSLADLGDALMQWRQTAHADAPCPACGVASDITQWDGGDGWAMGRVAMTFWNWPPLDPAFPAAVADVAGFSVRAIAGRI